jgi:hypothetical protein
LTPEEYKRVEKASKSSHQKVKAWIENMCHAATRDLISLHHNCSKFA